MSYEYKIKLRGRHCISFEDILLLRTAYAQHDKELWGGVSAVGNNHVINSWM